jgi:protein deglycase
MVKKILVPLAEGFETIEALSVVDVFRRAGAEVVVAAVGESQQVTSAHRVPVLADLLLQDCVGEIFDLIVLPGGIPGAQNLKKSEILAEMLQRQNQAGRMYGAICAAPAVVLEGQGLLAGKEATCHPSFAEQLSSGRRVDQDVVMSGNCVTGRGAGASIDFAMALLGLLLGEEKRRDVAKSMALPAT